MKKYTKTEEFTFIGEFADGSVILENDKTNKQITVSADAFREVYTEVKPKKEAKRGK